MPQPLHKSPKPDPNAVAPTEDEFLAWCEQPVTRWVALAYIRAADEARSEHAAVTWAGINPDPISTPRR